MIKVEKQGDKVAVSVKDNGIGIEKEKIPKLFGFDSNISSRGTNGESGIGIGLSLCHDLALINKKRAESRKHSRKRKHIYFAIINLPAQMSKKAAFLLLLA